MIKICGPFSRLSYEDINLNSPDQIKAFLLANGWIPTEWNYKVEKGTKRFARDERGKHIKTSPKLPKEGDLDLLEKQLGGTPIGRLLSRRYLLKHRKAILSNDRDDGKGWLGMVREDGRLGAVCIPQATNTGRARHKVVN